MIPSKNTFKKEERICLEKEIERLFEKSRSIFLYPLKILYIIEKQHDKYPAKVLITVSKKKFKRAVDRNIIKRRVREAYRKHKNPFYKSLIEQQLSLSLGIVYVGNEITTYKEIEKKIIIALQKVLVEAAFVSKN